MIEKFNFLFLFLSKLYIIQIKLNNPAPTKIKGLVLLSSDIISEEFIIRKNVIVKIGIIRKLIFSR